MTRFVQYIRRTLSTRISLWVLLSVTLLLVVALVVMFHYSHNAIEKESLAKAEQMLNGKVKYIENQMHRLEVATRNMHWNVERHLDDPDAMEIYCSEMVMNNPNVVGCAIAFAPNFYPEKGEFYTTYVYRDEEESDFVMMTHDPFVIEPDLYADVPYVGVNWYNIPMNVNTLCWVRPHAPNDTINSTIITCCMPIHDKTGRPVGVIATDVSVEWLSRTILREQPFPNSYCMMLGVQGTYIIHPDSTYLYHKLVTIETEKEKDPEVHKMVESMLAGEDGCRAVNFEGKDCFVLYKALNNGRWSACMVCPESDIFSANKRQQIYMVLVTLLAIGLIVCFCFYFVKKQLDPLNMLANSVKRITDGNYNTQIPSTNRVDEVGILQNNFGAMQTSLSRHIQKISKLSDVLQERNEELAEINARVKEADDMKMKLIHKIADKMILPIKEIDGVVATLDEQRSNLKKEDLQTMSEQMMSNTKAVTDLLDQMLNIPKKKKKKTS